MELRGMDQTSMEFVHDLKTPLQTIYSCIQLLDMEIGADSRAREYLNMMMHSARQMQGMVSGLMGGRTTHLRLTDVVGEVRRICEGCSLRARDRGIRVHFESNASRLCTMTDSEILARILQNLLSNALRYTPAGGSVRVELMATGDFWQLSVSDSGRGISEEILPHMFDAGVSEGGTGCGLAIVRECVDALRGTISVTSSETGSTFAVRLPVAA